MPYILIFPIILFTMAILAVISGSGIFWTLRHKQASTWTSLIWTVFSASISIGFMTFAMFIYITQDNVALALAIAGIGVLAVIIAGLLALL